jgi:hypothetical protein
LAAGAVVGNGESRAIVRAYLREHRFQARAAHLQQRKLQEGLILKGVFLSSFDIRSGDPIDIRIEFEARAAGQLHECAVLFYSSKGVRIAVVDTRESGLVPFRFRNGKFALVVQISALPLVEGDFTIGLYLVSTKFGGDLLELADLAVAAPRSERGFVTTYPSESRGVVVLSSSTSVVQDYGEVTAS